MMTRNLFKYTSLIFASSLVLAACGTDTDDDTDTADPDEEVVAPDPDEDDTTDDETGDSSDDIDDDEDDEDYEDEEIDEDDEDDEDDYAVSQDLDLWFPRLEDTLLEYDGEGMEYASFTRYPQFAYDSTLQMVESTAGTDVITVYEYTDDEVREIFVRPETYFRDDFMNTGLDSMQDEHDIILQLPIEIGHSWESPTGTVSEITNVDFEYETPFGTFDAIEVTRTHDDSQTVFIYAEDIGLVERVFTTSDDESEVISTLASRSKEQPEEIDLTVFPLDENAEGLLAVPVTVELYTNDAIRYELAEVLRGKSGGSDAPPLLTDNVSINFMYLGNDDIAYVDFSTDLVDDMNVGAGIESLLLQGLVNTIGGYYSVEEVYLTVDNEPYASGHIEREEGETWSVNHDSVSWEE
ncbi:MAG: GerMN domain-containing protein [Alkalibacterium sp.]|nr:GerMN domain-containing protein [Alkalibacterium sp.]